jgi:two-component system nitrogen regulation response regulator GlnG/two-component system response regulator HydG
VDIPLLLATLLSAVAADHPALHRFFDAAGRPRLHPDLVEALLRHRYTLHAREVARLLWRALGTSPGEFIALTPEVADELSHPPVNPSVAPPDRAAIEAALAATGGAMTAAAAALGLSSRFALYRLMKRYGMNEPEP